MYLNQIPQPSTKNIRTHMSQTYRNQEHTKIFHKKIKNNKTNPILRFSGLADSIWAPQNSSSEPANPAASNGRTPDAWGNKPRVQPRARPKRSQGLSGAAREFAPAHPRTPEPVAATENAYVASPAVSWGASPEEASAQRNHDTSHERHNIGAPSAQAAFDGSSSTEPEANKPPTLEELRRIRDEWKEREERAALEEEIRAIKARLQKRDPGN